MAQVLRGNIVHAPALGRAAHHWSTAAWCWRTASSPACTMTGCHGELATAPLVRDLRSTGTGHAVLCGHAPPRALSTPCWAWAWICRCWTGWTPTPSPPRRGLPTRTTPAASTAVWPPTSSPTAPPACACSPPSTPTPRWILMDELEQRRCHRLCGQGEHGSATACPATCRRPRRNPSARRCAGWTAAISTTSSPFSPPASPPAAPTS